MMELDKIESDDQEEQKINHIQSEEDDDYISDQLSQHRITSNLQYI